MAWGSISDLLIWSSVRNCANWFDEGSLLPCTTPESNLLPFHSIKA